MEKIINFKKYKRKYKKKKMTIWKACISAAWIIIILQFVLGFISNRLYDTGHIGLYSFCLTMVILILPTIAISLILIVHSSRVYDQEEEERYE